MGPFPTLAPLGGVIWEESAVFRTTENTKDFTETNLSKYGVFINAQTGEILAQREAYTRMNPASMTKMLTVLVAAEHLTAEDLDKTAPITIAITDYSFVNGCSNTGHALNEKSGICSTERFCPPARIPRWHWLFMWQAPTRLSWI